MLSLEELKKDRDLVAAIDWEMTPRQAFEAYQLKSVDNWKHRSLGTVHYFYLSTWKGRPRLFLVRRSLKQSQEIAEIQAPEHLVAACAAAQEGQDMPRGQLPLDDSLRDWLRGQLGV